jgi:hypothetical protein
MIDHFWYNITQIYPTSEMNVKEKISAICRLVFLMTILGYFFTNNMNLIIVGGLTLFLLYVIYRLKTNKVEGFKDNSFKNTIPLEKVLKKEFHPTTKTNPFGNVLLTDINDNPDRLSAAPSFNPDVYDNINSAVKEQTQMLNPDIINTNKQLYGDLYDNYQLDSSMMRFYATANSRVTDDQGAFAQWLYGDAPSGKSSDSDGAFARVRHNQQWINP